MVSRLRIAVKPNTDNLPIIVIRVTVYRQHTAGTAYASFRSRRIFLLYILTYCVVHARYTGTGHADTTK